MTYIKIQNIVFVLLIFTIFTSSCNRNEPDDYISQDPNKNETLENKWWILTHKNYKSPGIFLYNENTMAVELELELPKNLKSPHAIAYDGNALWVGGNGENESIYKLNPETGAILYEIKNISTEGIAIQDRFLYYSNYNTINKIEKNGTLVESIQTKNSTLNIPDIAIADNNLYYLRYTEKNPVIKLNLNNRTENAIYEMEGSGTYCLAVSNNEIITVTPLNEINHSYLRSGEHIATNPTIIEGWITAIAPHFEEVTDEN